MDNGAVLIIFRSIRFCKLVGRASFLTDLIAQAAYSSLSSCAKDRVFFGSACSVFGIQLKFKGGTLQYVYLNKTCL